MSKLISDISDDQFPTDVLQSSLPVLVDFWAAWCGPCKLIAPLVEEIASEYAGKLTVVKINTENYPATAAKYGVRGIPTLMLFKAGENIATKIGLVDKPSLVAFIDSHL